MKEFMLIASQIFLAILLVYAAVSDLRFRIIPNWLNGAVALLVLPYWIGLGLAPWPAMAIQIALALGVLAVFAAMFALGAIGGGDVKLLAALALWLPAGALLRLLLLMAVIGGVIAVITLAHHRARRLPGQPEVPYGVAIAIAAFWVLGQPFLNHFGA